AAGEEELVKAFLTALVAALILYRDGEALVEEGQLAQARAQGVEIVHRLGEDLAVGQKLDGGTALVGFALEFAGRDRHAALEGLEKFFAVAMDRHLEARGQRVHAGDAHAVEAGGNLVAALAELAAGVQH